MLEMIHGGHPQNKKGLNFQNDSISGKIVSL